MWAPEAREGSGGYVTPEGSPVTGRGRRGAAAAARAVPVAPAGRDGRGAPGGSPARDGAGSPPPPRSRSRAAGGGTGRCARPWACCSGSPAASSCSARVAVVITYEQTPVPTAARAATSFSQSVVYSKDGGLIGRFGTTNRKMLQYNEIPPDMINAVVAAEDRNFFNEGGISPPASCGPFIRTSRERRLAPGRLDHHPGVRPAVLQRHRHPADAQPQIKEIFVAMKVAKEKSKQWILTNYLNTIYLGQGAYGIEGGRRDLLRQAVRQAHRGAGRGDQPPSSSSRAPIRCRSTAPSSRPAALRAQRHGADGDPDPAEGRGDEVPGPRDHVPQTLGRDVWDPYRPHMVQNELKEHLPPDAGADLQRRLRHPHHRRRQEDGGAVRGRPRERSADQREQPSRSS